MKLEIRNGIIRGLPLAILVSFLLQGSAIIWWASAKARDDVFLEKRVVRLESKTVFNNKVQIQILQRLARIEEQNLSQRRLLDKIDKYIRK